MQEASFGPRGTLWSCARQDYEPPAPVRYDKPFEPYAMGVIDLDDGLRVLGRVVTDDLDALAPGAAVELIIEALCHDEEGGEVVSWKFRTL